MNNQNSLISFEEKRSSTFYVPEVGSNAFFRIGNGEINIFTKSDKPEFHLYTHSGSIESGEGEFTISYNDIYTNMSVIQNTGFIINDKININNTTMNVSGNLIFGNNSTLKMKYGLLKMNSMSVIYLTKDNINIELVSSKIRINGRIVVSYKNLYLLNNPDIIINPSCEIDVIGLEYPDRIYSLTNYEYDLREKIINPNTHGEYNNEFGRIGYSWIDGKVDINSKILKLSVLYGDAVLGDFKFRALGIQSSLVRGKQFISDIYVNKSSNLYISEEYKGHRYYNPELYLGFVLFNFKRAGNLTVDGTVIVDSTNSKISLDVESKIVINGELILRNGGKLVNANKYNKNNSIFINGTMIIDSIDQLIDFHRDNFIFGEGGKIIIKNPSSDQNNVLLSIPNGIKTSKLYKLFKNNLNHIEFHINRNTGIVIDEYYDHFNRSLVDWYNGVRIEKAIFDGLIKWNDGGFIELNNSIIPWVDTDCNLLHASRLFKSSGSSDIERLQEVVERLVYVGCGNILFRFIKDGNEKEIELTLKPIHVKSIYNQPLSDSYILETDSPGSLFIRNKVENINSETIVNELSKHVILQETKTTFEIEKI